MWNLNKTKHNSQIQGTNQIGGLPELEGEVGKMGECGQKVQTSSYKTGPEDVIYNMETLANNTYCIFESC